MSQLVIIKTELKIQIFIYFHLSAYTNIYRLS